MIAIFYIGLDRFSAQTKANHQELFDRLAKIAPIQVYHFLQPEFSREDCPVSGGVGSAGGLQTWDFMKAVQQVKGDIVIKLRTDVWFCSNTCDNVVEEVKSIIAGDHDVTYMGANSKDNYQTPYVRWPAPQHKKVPDFVIIARREAVLDIDRVTDHLANAGDVANGNKTFKIITKDLSRSYCVNNYVFLIRDELTPLDDWNIGLKFYQSYAYGGAALANWVRTMHRSKNKINSIAIVYVGADRFPEIGLPNHEPLIEEIRKLLPTKVYSFTHGYELRGECPWPESGAAQVWDFMESVDRVTEDLIIKFRPDLWFTPSSQEAVLSEIRKIIDDELDASFMGSNWKEYLGHEYTVLPVDQCATVQDFVVMARRSILMPKNSVHLSLHGTGSGKRSCGTKVFKSILQSYAIANNVLCQIYLVRKTYDIVDPWQVGLDYILSYRKQHKMPDAVPWYLSTRPNET